MDGSFSLESALERFLARCPKLRSFPKFDLLSGKVSVSFSIVQLCLVAEKIEELKWFSTVLDDQNIYDMD